MRTYARFLVLGFMELVAYRVAVVMLAFSIPIVLFSRYYLFAALYRRPDEVVGGYSLRGILTYVAMAWLLRSFFRTNIDRRIGRDVLSGDIVFDLMRPLNFHLMMAFRGLGKSLNRLLVISLPLIVILLVSDILALPESPAAWGAFLFAVLLAYAISFEIQYAIGLMAFFTGYNLNLIWTFDMIMQLASGLILPLHFFPESVARLMMALPFRHVYYTPVQLFAGQIAPADAPALFVNAFAGLIVLVLFNETIFALGRRRVMIAGG